MILHTQNGSIYEVTESTMQRVVVGSDSQALRQDGEVLRIMTWLTEPTVGESFQVLLAPLEPHLSGVSGTVRMTSPVTHIEE